MKDFLFYNSVSSAASRMKHEATVEGGFDKFCKLVSSALQSNDKAEKCAAEAIYCLPWDGDHEYEQDGLLQYWHGRSLNREDIDRVLST